ncbi:hypothetical protein [Acidihalobacter prosperus]|uniref:DUF1641 domain-containing protein n=1 Tax=Acidihalobacter prosperus TaxID=160660 RepID=A0A1A6C252_9GAMM|nr:hypothetical protein [Acidihalobacter prosperus]OBS08629.1 hypothetical protein Thpro_022879 [Acidihalobacter prosperus]
MSNAARTLQDAAPGVELTADQLTGLGRIGDTANQVTDLLKMSQTVLEDLRDGIDVDAIADRIGPEMEALIQTLGEVMRVLGIDSVQSLHEKVHNGVQTLEESRAIEAAPELIALVGSLHESGLLKLLPPILTQLRGLTGSIDAERLGERLAGLNASLAYWADTAREGLRIAGDQLGELDVPAQLAKLEDLADQWWHIALRAKRLAQGDAETLGDRVEWLVGHAERLSGQIGPVVGALAELAPEALKSVDFSTVAAKITNGAVEWIEIGMQAHALVKGDSESLAARVRAMLEGAREAGLDQMIPDLMGMLGTVNRTGLLRKLNMLLTTLEPHIPADAELKRWLEQGTTLAQRYQPQIAGALPALDGALKAMEGTEKKGGGLFGLLGIVFSRKTQYVLRFAIEFAYRFLRGNK